MNRIGRPALDDDFVEADMLIVMAVPGGDGGHDCAQLLDGEPLVFIVCDELVQIFGAHLLEKSQMPCIDADDRAGGEGTGMNRLQKCAVATDADDEPGVLGKFPRYGIPPVGEFFGQALFGIERTVRVVGKNVDQFVFHIVLPKTKDRW